MKAYCFTRGLKADPHIAAALGMTFEYVRMPGGAGVQPEAGSCVVGWGQKENTRRARAFASKHALPYLSLEDGFIGYWGHPASDGRRLSVIADDVGIYYDATRESKLERLYNNTAAWCTPDTLARAERARARIQAFSLSKYNHSPRSQPSSLQALAGQKWVLVVDQTAGDKSITLGGATSQSFERMLDAALSENPDALVLIKTHPDVLAGQKKGHFSPRDLAAKPGNERIRFYAGDIAPQMLMESASCVYVVTSQYGFDALLVGKTVRVFGMPFYAGWGLTKDEQQNSRRTKTLTLNELVAGALIAYPTYYDPFRAQPCSLEQVLDYLCDERLMPRCTGQRIFAVGFSFWKRSFVRQFLSGGKNVRFVGPRAFETIKWKDGDTVAVWGRRYDAALSLLPKSVSVWRMEDGFVRSTGLGSELQRPASLVFDQTGIYYDGGAESDIEHFLKSHTFSERQLARGARILAAIKEARLSKYNLAGSENLTGLKGAANGKPILLVAGQVESDASLAFGAPNVQTNRALLEAVRQENPDAFIVYKPHPDVVTQSRAGDKDGLDGAGLADHILLDADIIDAIDVADSVHVMTSLTGFEALVRGKPVSVYGAPFYAGWGLTTDKMQHVRRGRPLNLQALVFSVLCVYPRYVSWPTGQLTVVEEIVATFSRQQKNAAPPVKGAIGWMKKIFRKSGFLFTALLR